MPDTGLPWEIPYAAPADLVRDWPALSEDVADAVAAGLTAANTGIGSNVVQTVKTDTFTTSSTSFTSITGLSASITPSTNTSKVLVIAFVNFGASNAGHLRIVGGNSSGFIGDAASARELATATWGIQQSDYRSDNGQQAATIVYLDSPASASSVTYGLDGRVGTGTILAINRNALDADNINSARTASSIVLIEVAA
jgi:hypothetical protein